MSDVSGLSHEYASASHLSAALNSSLVTLKKRQLHLPGADSISTDKLRSAQETLAVIVRLVWLLLQDRDAATGVEPALEAAAKIPPSFVSRLREDWRGQLQWRLEDLESIRDRLTVQENPVLAPQDFDRLDELARIAEAETSKVFRLMMRST